MAASKNTLPVIDPLVTLKKEARERIEGMSKDIESSKSLLDALDSLGLDVTRDRERIEWAEHAREVILKHTK